MLAARFYFKTVKVWNSPQEAMSNFTKTAQTQSMFKTWKNEAVSLNMHLLSYKETSASMGKVVLDARYCSFSTVLSRTYSDTLYGCSVFLSWLLGLCGEQVGKSVRVCRAAAAQRLSFWESFVYTCSKVHSCSTCLHCISPKSVSRSNFFIAVYTIITLHEAPTRDFHAGVYHESGAVSFKLKNILSDLRCSCVWVILIQSEHLAWAAGRNISIQVSIRTHAHLYEKCSWSS